MAKIYANLRAPEYSDIDYMEEFCYPDSAAFDQESLLPQLSINRMDPLSQVFSLKWNNHRTNMITVLERLLSTEAFCDVTIACEGGSIKCHKIVLSASSTYFEKLFLDNSCEHPIVFLKDVKEHQMRAIIEYMYRGDVNVSQAELPALLRVAELLKVKGMMEEKRDCKNPGMIGGGPRTSSPEPTPPSASATPATSPRAAAEQRLSASSTSTMPQQAGGAITPTSAQPPPPPPGPLAHNFRPFLTPPGQGSTPPFPMWPLPGLFPGHHNLFSPREDLKSLSPGPKERAKISSGSSTDKESSIPPLISRPADDDKPGYERQNGDGDDRGYEKSPKQPGGGGYGGKLEGMYGGNGGGGGGGGNQGKLEGIAGYVPTQRLEWKRYKQYTRSDIMAAIEEVKKGKSALQVSKKFNIPSRTLYDKVKKMGITTGRQQQRKSMGGNFNSYSAAFPGMNMMSPLSRLDGMNMENPYKDLMDRMRESREEEERESREGEGVQQPPFNILSPHMLNMMDRMKGEGETSPMNLSSERDEKPRVSEGSIPQSPSPSSAELTSPSNPHTSPADYHQPTSADPRSHSPQPIDIRAQFLADLRRLNDRPASPIEAADDNSRHNAAAVNVGVVGSYSSSPTAKDTLPPRKRKVSQGSIESAAAAVKMTGNGAPNGLHEAADRESAQVN